MPRGPQIALVDYKQRSPRIEDIPRVTTKCGNFAPYHTATSSTRHMYSFLPMGCLQKYCNLAWLRLYPRNSQPPRNFLDPVTGANTQRIECHWGHIKTRLVRCMHGTSETLLPSHLAEYWWEHDAPCHACQRHSRRNGSPVPVPLSTFFSLIHTRL